MAGIRPHDTSTKSGTIQLSNYKAVNLGFMVRAFSMPLYNANIVGSNSILHENIHDMTMILFWHKIYVEYFISIV